MVTVTKTATVENMMDNIILYLSTYVTDPESANRTSASQTTYDNKWVKMFDSQGMNFAPNIYVEMPTDAGNTSTGIRSQLRTMRFGIHIHGRDAREATSLGDSAYYQLVLDNGGFFETALMWRPHNWITNPEVAKHPDSMGSYLAKFYVTFRFYHSI